MSDLIDRLQESIADAAAYETCAVVPLPELRWAAAELTRLREENARLREDAERYRYLASLMRGEPELMGDAYGFRWVLPDGILSERMMLRDAIDAAMREAK